jgi:hypothetical protein
VTTVPGWFAVELTAPGRIEATRIRRLEIAAKAASDFEREAARLEPEVSQSRDGR